MSRVAFRANARHRPPAILSARSIQTPDRGIRRPAVPRLLGLLGILLASAQMAVAAGPAGVAPVPLGATFDWRGGAGDLRWSKAANWEGGIVPGPFDVARFDALSPDALLDPSSGGTVAGLILEHGYAGTLVLGRDLTIGGRLDIEGGKLLQGGNQLATEELRQSGGTLLGGVAPLWIEGEASVRGGLLETPRDVMRTGTLDIRAPRIVRVGENGRLNIAGGGTPLTGDGLLDTTTNRPTSVEYTGHATTDLTTAGPAAAYRQIGVAGQGRGGDLRHVTPGGGSARRPRAPLAFGDPETTLTLQGGFNRFSSAVIDSAAHFAYFGTDTSPGIILKFHLPDLSLVDFLTLNAGESYLTSAVIDPAGGFAYFGTDTWPGAIVKVRLSDFTRVSTMWLPSGENFLWSAVIDPAAGFAYFGTLTSPGIVVKVRLSDFTRVGAVTLNTGHEYLFCAVIDPVAGFAYFGTYEGGGYPGVVVKVRLSDLTDVGALTIGPSLASAVIDPAGGFAYFGDYFGRNVRIVRLSDFTYVITPPLLSAGEALAKSAVIDLSNPDPKLRFAYFGTEASPGTVVKVRLWDFTRVSTLTLNSGEDSPWSAVIDPAGGFAYFGTYTDPGIVAKIDLSSFGRVGATNPANYPSGEDYLGSAVIDLSNPDPKLRFAYFGTNTIPGIVVKVHLSDFTRVCGLTLTPPNTPFNINYLTSAVIDPAAGYAYFGSTSTVMGTVVGTVVKVNLSGGCPTFAGKLTLSTNEKPLSSAVIDVSNPDPALRFAYFGTGTSPGKVVKVNLSTFTEDPGGPLQLGSGEDNLASAVIDVSNPDPALRFAYFGTATSTSFGKVVKVRLSDFAEVIPALTFSDTSGYGFSSAVIDPAGGFAYFGNRLYGPGTIERVRLSNFTRAGSLGLLNTSESNLTSAVIDLSNPDPTLRFAYFGTNTVPGIVVKVHLSDFTRVGALTLDNTLNVYQSFLTSAVIDPAAGFAYFGNNTSAGIISRVDLSSLFGTTTQVASSVNPSVVGQLVTFTATVNLVSGSGLPTGTVQFRADGTNLGMPVGLTPGFFGQVASVSTSSLLVATHAITAIYGGDSSFRTSIGTLSGGQVVRVTAPATATVTGGGSICPGASTSVQAALTGTPPWSITWSDSVTQSGLLTSPATRGVSPAVTTTYTVTALSDANGPGTATGSALVTVNPPPAMPVITAPATVGAGSPNHIASVPAHAGSTYTWTIGNGTITAGQGTSQITFTAGIAGTPLTLSVTETNAFGCVSAPGNASVTVVPAGSAALFYTLPPCRVLDTRNPTGPLGAPPLQPGATRTFNVAASPCGIPADAVAISANLAVTTVGAQGELVVFPSDVPRPNTSSISFRAGRTRANNAIVAFSKSGATFSIFNNSTSTVDFILDVNAYFR